MNCDLLCPVYFQQILIVALASYIKIKLDLMGKLNYL